MLDFHDEDEDDRYRLPREYPTRRMRTMTLIMWVGLPFFVIWLIWALFFAVSAYAHDHKGMVFDPWCCNGNSTTGDCQEIPRQSVRAVNGGYQVVLAPGQHPRVILKSHVYFVPQDKVRDSTNGLYYACIYPNEATLRCFYAPPPGA